MNLVLALSYLCSVRHTMIGQGCDQDKIKKRERVGSWGQDTTSAPKNELKHNLSEMILCNSKLYVTTGKALASSYDLARQTWLDLEELRRYLHCVKLVYL